MTVYEYYKFYEPEVSFADEFRFLRKSLHMTQKELAAITSIPYHNITSWEQGYRLPKKYIQPLILQYMLDLVTSKDPNFLYCHG